MMLTASGGGPAAEAQVRRAVQMMRGASDRQIEVLSTFAAFAARAAKALAEARAALRRQPLLAAAIAVLLLAVVLRWLGVA